MIEIHDSGRLLAVIVRASFHERADKTRFDPPPFEARIPRGEGE